MTNTNGEKPSKIAETFRVIKKQFIFSYLDSRVCVTAREKSRGEITEWIWDQTGVIDD